MNLIQFGKVETKALKLKTFLLVKFAVPFLAASYVCVVQEAWKYLVCRCKKRKDNSRRAFNYSFIFYEIRNIIV